ncbi:TetR/AcrR family transcriptional regulator [Streptomyces sp. NPDC058373]|uniref:TetR/AcrR family transcriptional regulator n=1 Tax=unclassified Streptomyces TaxID=2593676 RepID=UPI0036531F31
MEKRPYHHGDLRAALLARAGQTLRERGAGALSLRELARDLGVSPGAPRRHFATKQALLDALALDGFERLVEATAAAQSSAGRPFPERLDAMARAYVGFSLSDPALVGLMFSAKHSPEASQGLREAALRWVDQGLALIRDGQSRGEVREDPPDRVALTVLAPLHGYTGLASSGVPLPQTPDQGLDDVIAAIARACAPA